MKKDNIDLDEYETDIFEPRGAQIEALYALNKSRKNGFDNGLIVATTCIGTYVAVFNSK